MKDLPKNWIVDYKDIDGDMITMTCEDDFKSMLDTTSVQYLKITVKSGEWTDEYPVLKDEKVTRPTESKEPEINKVEESEPKK